MEYRAYVQIGGLSWRDEQAYEPLIDRLERRHLDLGPVLGWDTDSDVATVTVALDGDTAAVAGTRARGVVADALSAVALPQSVGAVTVERIG